MEACRGVARHWANLSNIDDVTERAKQLEKFYFNGMKRDGMKFAPVVHADHYGPMGGQIRVNLFRSFADGWQLRDFQTDISDALSLIIKPASVKGNPHGPLFNSGSGEPLSGDFQDHFLTQLASLAADDLNGISMSTPLEFNAGQSNEQGPENDYATQLNQDPDYRDEIDFMLQDAGINLTAVEVARRATAMSCAGCHQLSNGDDLGDGLQWPTKSTAFVHTEENVLETGPDGARHKISEALTDLFLPARKTVLVDFINDTRCQKLVCDPVAITPSLISAKADNSLQGVKNTIGGTFVH